VGLRAGLRQHQLVVAEKVLLEATLTGAITVLSELLAGVDPVMFSRSQAVRDWSVRVASELGCREIWAIEIAALLAPIGRIALPRGNETIKGRPTALDALIAAMPQVGARLLEPIPRLEGVAKIIRYQGKGYDGSGLPADDLKGELIPLESRILKVLWDFHELLHARRSAAVAMEEMRLRPKAYDPEVLEAFATLLESAPASSEVGNVRLRDLRAGMTLASDLLDENGSLILPAGLRLGAGHMELLSILEGTVTLQEPVAILLQEGKPHEA
jgi:response regulator RpfG family c-di-GMP phosphodiesterase